ncbi:pseudouridine synthase RluA family [Clostridium sp. CAG:470]|nr:MAG: hypothetical protein BHW03_04835 [Clostridium sp. 28_17]CDE14016.1 pseudouridine synthase RluA family [Clostridium sp. CAG:470]
MEINYEIKNNTQTINSTLQNELKISSRLLYKLIKLNKIELNHKPCDTRKTGTFGDTITINFDYEEDNSNIIPTKMNLNIIFEDDWLLVVNKPAGIAIHPSVLHYSDSLCNGIKFYFDKIGLKKKIRPVNRLDLNTSGLVVFAKCEYIQECLINQMKNNQFKKEYLAVCNGFFDKKSGTINLPIARKENSIIERCISENGQPAITHYEVLKEFDNYSLVKCSLETGRTHQIRVHMSAIGHPLLGDSLYGSISDLINRQALHCFNLQFIHPVYNNDLNFWGDLPNDFKIFDIK